MKLSNVTITALRGLGPRRGARGALAPFSSVAARTAAPAALADDLQATVGLSPKRSPFPSLLVTREGVEACGSFARTQAEYLEPDAALVAEVNAALSRARLGVVAHFYMDAEIQGVLSALKWPHVFVSDSLAMGDAASRMVAPPPAADNADDDAAPAAEAVVCLGVDFMAESAAATLGADHARGGANAPLDPERVAPVYRTADKHIGCTLAASAERAAYAAFLAKGAARARAEGSAALHVVYINTSLATKAHSQAAMPTLACTSSNVVGALLAAFAQLPPTARVLYGPDTYMGRNLRRLLGAVIADPRYDDATIAAELHPAHTNATLASALERLDVFEQGHCAVHHMFGGAVAETVERDYYRPGGAAAGDEHDGGRAYVTAHLEVPGGMFELALEARRAGRGCVGSTKDILDFIVAKTRLAAAGARDDGAPVGSAAPLQFVLGTEAGMASAIVAGVQAELQAAAAGSDGVTVEIVFPVSDDAVAALPAPGDVPPGDALASLVASAPGGAAAADAAAGIAAQKNQTTTLMPGVQGGEGCSANGGCATCPFMKMNTIDSLIDLAAKVERQRDAARALARIAAMPEGGAEEADLRDELASAERALAPFVPPNRLGEMLIGGRPAVELGGVPIANMRAFMAASAGGPSRLPDSLVEDAMTRFVQDDKTTDAAATAA